MKVVIDLGNTFVKIAIFHCHKIVQDYKTIPENAINQLNVLLQQYPDTKHLLYAATGHVDTEFINFIHTHFKVFTLDQTTPQVFTNTYQTPETLGLDRIALVSAAVQNYPNKNVLIIDAGTCITYDFVDCHTKYHGGSISPGLQMRYNALHTFTAKLPKIYFEDIQPNLIGKNTIESIHNGVLNGIIYEIDNNIEKYKLRYKDLTVILTGGDSQYLSTQLKNSIFVNLKFQLIGLYAILQNLLNG